MSKMRAEKEGRVILEKQKAESSKSGKQESEKTGTESLQFLLYAFEMRIESAGRSMRWSKLPSRSRKNSTLPPPPAGLTGSVKVTPRRSSSARVAAMESTRKAT